MSDITENIKEIYRKIPPYCAESERGALGGALLKHSVDHIASIVQPADFYENRNRIIFETMLKVVSRGEPLDLLTLTAEFNRAGNIDTAGGITYLSGLTEASPTAHRAPDYARTVRDRATVRGIITAAQEITGKGYENPENVQEFTAEAQALIFDATRSAGREVTPWGTLVNDTVTFMERVSSGNVPVGLQTGFSQLDRVIGGFRKGEFIVIAGRPSMGKTALATQTAMALGVPYAFFSVETPEQMITLRKICQLSGQNLHNVLTGRGIDKEGWARILRVTTELAKRTIVIDDSRPLTVTGIESRARQYVADHDVKIIFVDYLQLMSVPGIKNDRTREVTVIAESLKALAKNLKIPVVALAQLNRAVESRDNKRPRMSDLRESGGIENEADLIMSIYRDWYYQRDKQKPEDERPEDLVEINVLKNRNGPTQNVKLSFEEDSMWFRSVI